MAEMTRMEFLACCQRMECEPHWLDDHLQVSRKTVASWIRGRAPIKPNLAAWMRACAAGELDPDTTWPDGWWACRQRDSDRG